jgi:hypothetical protein
MAFRQPLTDLSTSYNGLSVLLPPSRRPIESLVWELPATSTKRFDDKLAKKMKRRDHSRLRATSSDSPGLCRRIKQVPRSEVNVGADEASG